MTPRIALLATLLLVGAAPCGAQPPASGTTPSATPSAAPADSTPSSSTTSSSDKPPPAAAAGTDAAATATEPSPELLKAARREGFTPKKRNGVTKFCQSEAKMNTRFVTETCIDEAQLQQTIQQRQDVRNQLSQQGACVGACKGH
jgi:hypothetical protein